mmetsp:Transcript_57695/g.146352  ORF Transcript_57695/g.146352 Transcript_57695/m.146352 type:complete len:223 (+) Transcript_57695:382-1050(+)
MSLPAAVDGPTLLRLVRGAPLALRHDAGVGGVAKHDVHAMDVAGILSLRFSGQAQLLVGVGARPGARGNRVLRQEGLEVLKPGVGGEPRIPFFMVLDAGLHRPENATMARFTLLCGPAQGRHCVGRLRRRRLGQAARGLLKHRGGLFVVAALCACRYGRQRSATYQAQSSSARDQCRASAAREARLLAISRGVQRGRNEHPLFSACRCCACGERVRHHLEMV